VAESAARLAQRGKQKEEPYEHQTNRSSEEGYMCPACISSTAVMVAAATSTGGILVVCIGKFKNLFRTSGLSLFQKTKEK
jgi:hypothetical protein